MRLFSAIGTLLKSVKIALLKRTRSGALFLREISAVKLNSWRAKNSFI